MSISDFEIIKELGQGKRSRVLLVRRPEDGQQYALKQIETEKMQRKEIEQALNEIRILASIKSKYILQYRQAFYDEDKQSIWLVMEYADDRDLFYKIKHAMKKGKLFKEGWVWKIFCNVLQGLKTLHDMSILHRDITWANVFLFKNGSAKLGDFYTAKEAQRGMLFTQTGTPYYAAPEVWQDCPYHDKSDIWSLGVVLYETLSLGPPFRADSMKNLAKKVLKGLYPSIPNCYSAKLSNLVRMMLQVSANKRPNANQLLSQYNIAKIIKKRVLPWTDQLIKTIEIPHDMSMLNRKLPPPNYNKPGTPSRSQSPDDSAFEDSPINEQPQIAYKRLSQLGDMLALQIKPNLMPEFRNRNFSKNQAKEKPLLKKPSTKSFNRGKSLASISNRHIAEMPKRFPKINESALGLQSNSSLNTSKDRLVSKSFNSGAPRESVRIQTLRNIKRMKVVQSQANLKNFRIASQVPRYASKSTLR